MIRCNYDDVITYSRLSGNPFEFNILERNLALYNITSDPANNYEATFSFRPNEIHRVKFISFPHLPEFFYKEAFYFVKNAPYLVEALIMNANEIQNAGL